MRHFEPFFNENERISIMISLKFVPTGPDNGLAQNAIIWTNGV